MRAVADNTTGLDSAVRSVPVILVVVLAGLGLALSAVAMSPLLVFGAVLGLVLVGGFLVRPDIALSVVLIGRAASDLSVIGVGSLRAGSGLPLGSLLNIGLALILILGGGLYILAHRAPLFRVSGGGLLGLLLLVGIVGILRAESLVFSFSQWLPVVGGFVTYSLAAHVFSTPERVEHMVRALALSFVLPAAFGLHQLVTGTHLLVPNVRIERLLGTFVHPNPFGIYLIFVLSVFLSQALVPARHRRDISLLIVALSLVLLVGTQTRIAWIGAVVVVLVIGVLRSRVLLLVLPVLAGAAWFVAPSVQGRLADPLGGSFADRLVNVWPPLFRAWLRETATGEPWISASINRLVGLGPGSVEPLSLAARGGVVAAHNDYLRVLIEYGLFGLVLYLVLVLVLITTAYKTWRIASDGRMGAVALAFLAVAVAFPIMSLTDNLFAGTQNQLYFWTLAGASVAIARFGARSLPAGDAIEGGKRKG